MRVIRRYFEELCQAELHRLDAKLQVASMIMSDLNRFKSINGRFWAAALPVGCS